MERCERCGRPVLDDTTDFGNGLFLRSTCDGIMVGIWDDVKRRAEWLRGTVTRAELQAFLGGHEQ